MPPISQNLQTILNFLIKLILFFLSLFLFTKLAGPLPFSVNSINTTKSDAFSVTGEGKAEIKPDFATVRAGVTSNAPSVKAAQEQMNLSITKVTDAIKNVGIDPKDIQTENYSINPVYDYSNNSQKITGYSAYTNLVIKIKDLEKANQIIDLATQNGANQIGGLTFDNSDKIPAENEARQKAVDAAKKKAADAARIAGFNLGKIINYQESLNGSPPIIYADRALSGMGGGGDTKIEPGSNEVIINVTLSYEVR